MGEDVIGLVGIARDRGNMATTRSNVIVPVDEFVREPPQTGWYISKKVAVLFFVGAAALTAAVGLTVYFANHDQRRMGAGYRETNVPSLTGAPCVTNPVQTANVTSLETTVAPPTEETPVQLDLRLPGTIVPYHYNLRLLPDIYTGDPSTFGFTGHVEMRFSVANTTDVIVLHAGNLTVDIDSVLVNSTDSSDSIAVVDVEYDFEREFVTISLTKSLHVDRRYVVALSYNGLITSNLKGLYYSSYKIDGETRYLVASHLEPTHARKIFPGLDEPSYKATFNTTIERPANMTSWSNSALHHSEPIDGGWFADHYSTTPVMSTYNLAFVVADFKCRNATTTRGNSVEICARPNAVQQMDLAVSIAGEMQEWFENYFNVSYPLPKMVHLAVPDFGSGAMENWGLILYAETSLLFDPRTGTAANKKRVALVIAHELAHQWFGNLVTMQWWDEIWLNEAFATYFQTLPVSATFPDWQMDDQFVTGTLQGALSFDMSATSHPVVQDVNTPSEIKQMFDRIIYNKGGSILRMLKYLLGEETFRTGLSRYLAARAYKSATHDDLFRALSEQSRLDGKSFDVQKFMDPWILQMGYPVVRFDYKPASGVLYLTQKHFLLNEDANVTSSPFNYTWLLPITYATDRSGNEENPTVEWLESSHGKLSVPRNAKWILGNVRQQYPYRVTYDTDTWRALIRQLSTDHEKIHIRNRAQIIDDAFQLGRAGVEDQTLALDVSRYIDKERGLIPWITWTKQIFFFDRMLSFTIDYQLYLKYVQRQVTPMFDVMQRSQDDSHVQRRLRSVVFDTACSIGLRRCLDISTQHFHAWMEAHSRQNITAMKASPQASVTSSSSPVSATSNWTANSTSTPASVLSQQPAMDSTFTGTSNLSDNAFTTPGSVLAQSNGSSMYDQTPPHAANNIDPDIRSAVYCGAIRNGDSAEWQFAFERYKDPDVGLDAQNLMSALGCSRDIWQLRSFLQMAMDEVDIRRQDARTVFASVAENPNGQKLAWDFFVENWPIIEERFSVLSFTLSYMIRSVTQSFSTEKELKELEAFGESTKDGSAARIAVTRAVENTRTNIAWRSKNEVKVIEWLRQHV